MDEKNTMIPLSGLWQKKDKNGNTYFNGTLGSGRLIIFKNNRKEKENQPDYIMFIAPQVQKGAKAALDDEEIPF